MPTTTLPNPPTNADVAKKLREHAAALAGAGDNLYRVRAFRQAAFTVMGLDVPLAEAGPAGLRHVRGIGPSLSKTILAFVQSGEWRPESGRPGDGDRSGCG